MSEVSPGLKRLEIVVNYNLYGHVRVAVANGFALTKLANVNDPDVLRLVCTTAIFALS